VVLVVLLGVAALGCRPLPMFGFGFEDQLLAGAVDFCSAPEHTPDPSILS